MNIQLADVRVAEPTGWALRVPQLKGEAAIYDLTHWVLVAPSGVVLTRPESGDVTITGEALRASISHVTEYPPRISVEGAKLTFVPAPGADGLVPLRSLSDDYYDHDEGLHLLTGRRTGREFRLGQAVEVILTEVNPLSGSMIFDVLGGNEPAPARYRGRRIPSARGPRR